MLIQFFHRLQLGLFIKKLSTRLIQILTIVTIGTLLKIALNLFPLFLNRGDHDILTALRCILLIICIVIETTLYTIYLITQFFKI